MPGAAARRCAVERAGSPVRPAPRVHNLRYEVEVSRRKGARSAPVCRRWAPSGVPATQHRPQSNIGGRAGSNTSSRAATTWPSGAIAEHTYYDPCYDEYEAFDRQVGDDEHPWYSPGTSVHAFCMVLAGYNNAYYILSDHTAQ